jgi:HSP20 family protein
MKLVKYHRPFDMFDSMFHGMNRGLFPAYLGACDTETKAETPAMRLPRTNVVEKDDSYVFTMEMPGLSKEDLEVSVENDTLTVTGEKTVEKKAEKDEHSTLRREIRSSKFERSFSMGNEVDQDKIKASMKEGVLTITLPKSSEKVGRKVDVN